LVEHLVATLVGQRVFGIALGYEDINDHDELRHDPIMAVLAGKLEAGRTDCAPVAGKSTLNRLELSRATATRYHKIALRGTSRKTSLPAPTGSRAATHAATVEPRRLPRPRGHRCRQVLQTRTASRKCQSHDDDNPRSGPCAAFVP
jgi:hypothetical protein